jgi:hypothetical protein
MDDCNGEIHERRAKLCNFIVHENDSKLYIVIRVHKKWPKCAILYAKELLLTRRFMHGEY